MKKLLALLTIILLSFAVACKPEKKEMPTESVKEIILHRHIIQGTINIKDVDLDTIASSKKDFLNLQKTISQDNIIFLYPYKYIKTYTDKLIINKDHVILRENLKYISEKTFSLDGKPIVIKKYLQDIKPRGPVGNIFINDSLGIVITRELSHPYSAHIACYDVENHRNLHKMIAADSAFFELEL